MNLVALYEKDAVATVAGFRLMEKLSSGKTLYVDGGKALLDWLKA
jgi:hypothetical protein